MKYLMGFIIIVLVFFSLSAKETYYVKNGAAIDGFDTVSYFTEGKAVKGESRFSTEHDGITWHFSSEKNLKLFKADPDMFLPEYGGYCAYGLGDGGYLAPVDPTAFKILNGRLFLNYSHSINKKWLKKTDYYIERGDKIWKEKYAK